MTDKIFNVLNCFEKINLFDFINYRKPLRTTACSKRVNLGLTACSKHVKMIISCPPLVLQGKTQILGFNAALKPKILIKMIILIAIILIVFSLFLIFGN